jgi:hypothetical protein
MKGRLVFGMLALGVVVLGVQSPRARASISQGVKPVPVPTLVVPKPDIVGSNITIERQLGGPAPFDIGKPCFIRATVTNKGKAPAGPFKIAFYIRYNDSLTNPPKPATLTCEITGTLAPGASTSCLSTTSYTPTKEGWYVLETMADVGNQVAESNDWNNGLSTSRHTVSPIPPG